MKLNVPERLILSRLLPEKGNFETMATIEKLREKLYLSEEETVDFEIKQDGDHISWGPKGSEEIEIELSIKGKSLLLKVLEELDEKEELSLAQYSIYKKFKEDK